MYRRQMIFFPFILTVIFLLSGCDKKQPVVAKIDGKSEITLKELNDFIGLRFPRRKSIWRN
jgi:hypothetical protein